MVLGATERCSHKGKKLKVWLTLEYVNISITLITSSKVAALKSEPHSFALDLNSSGDIIIFLLLAPSFLFFFSFLYRIKLV